LQLVEHGVAWFDPRTEKKCNVSNFEKFTGYRTQKAFIHSKALQGDAGDNIKPKTGVGEKGALDLLAAFDDVHEFLRTPLDQALNRFVAHHVEKPKTWAGLAKFHGNQEAHERFEFALKMMDLGHPEIPAPKNIRGTKAKVDRDGFVKFCSEFGFASILKDVDAFLSPFIQLEQEFSN
jgi:5'-3' exonuclease